MSETDSKKVSLTLDEELYLKIKELAKQNIRSVHGQILYLVQVGILNDNRTEGGASIPNEDA